jgi:hypothetical protein
VKLAGWLTKARNGEDSRHQGPGNFLPSSGHDSIKANIEFEQSLQPPGQPDITELAEAFHVDVSELG